MDIFDPATADHIFHDDLREIETHRGGVNARMNLVTRHRGGAVVQNDESELVVVVHRVDQPGDAGMEESGISDKGHHFLVRGRGKPARRAHRRSHADHEIPHGQRRQQPQCVAPDVRRIDRIRTVHFFNGIEGGPVRATCAKGRWPPRKRRQVGYVHDRRRFVFQTEG